MMTHHVRPASTSRFPLDDEASTPEAEALPSLIADLADCVIIPVTHQQRAVKHFTVDLAFSYQTAASNELLLQSLEITLSDFPVLCGRALKLQRDETSATEELVLCVPKIQCLDAAPSWAYVPLSFDSKPTIESDTEGIAPNDWFDMAINCIPSDACHISSLAKDGIHTRKFGDPMTRIQVSTVDTTKHQVIAISINHVLVDAGSISLFMSEWSRQYQMCRERFSSAGVKPEDVERVSISFDHPLLLDMDGQDKDEETDVPDDWTRLLPSESGGENPFVENKAAEMMTSSETVSCSVYYRSRDQIEVLKNESLEDIRRLMQEQQDEDVPPYVSSNDALLGEVCKELGATSIILCMDWRPILNRPTFFGYAVLLLYVDLPTASHAPATCRNLLGWKGCNGAEGCAGIVRNANFVEWKMKNETKQGRTDLIWNSWSDFFTLDDGNVSYRDDRSSKMECCPHDMLMSEQMCRARVDVARRGVSYAIIFPQPNRSVRLYFFGPNDVGQSLQSIKQ